MKKIKYIASVWVPNHVHPGTDKSASIDFERIVDHGTSAPFYESDNYTAVFVNLENGECRTYANMPYRLIVRPVQLLTWEEFDKGVKFKTDLSADGQIYSYDLIDGEPRLVIHKRDRRLTPGNAIVVKSIKHGEYIQLADENNTRLYFHEMYKYE